MDVTIAGVTHKQYQQVIRGYGNTTLLFMNQKGFLKSLWADSKRGNEAQTGTCDIFGMVAEMQMNIRYIRKGDGRKY